MDLNYRFWIASDENERIFGYGLYQLLRYVKLLGSLNKACHAMNIPYHKASFIISRCEKHFNKPIIIRAAGGVGGGGSVVSDFALGLMKRYEDFLEDADLQLRQLYLEYFNDLDQGEIQ
ncbi:molybdenum-binding protein [Acidaminobacter sp. JC074]|uniref:winged helix-turn-helix domain-containing protein n=1 Tax=Acidaminobacter sp. JC074 TaxID=2530199 RepID=UPI001F1177DA|nr:hypothetical protein [Acidaminobacter sp. JC074]MCH4886134.1 molybdenum-binding protein [Acidaminobacter sp. JC074]